MQVNNNGVISFLVSVSQFTPDPFPLDDGRRLLTPFWADIDTTNGGTLSYRQVLRFAQNDAIFLEADDIIRASFVDMRDFVSSWMYITTWDSVAFFGASDTSIRNSFQAVMVTDGRYSFAIFNYGDINWTTGAASGGDSGTGLGGTPAQVGFNAGDGVIFYSAPGSRTAAVVDIETTSNIGVPGRWVFRTDNSNIEGLECTTSGV
ncbi:sushi, nidogen and EGF-like domain-containing protein 1 [Strongylocentrotus purpuratus]|uniref:NIDO domain-containing protein n=1 Tax=Strongylocentrotus purpuratus TaxID=7668 RepID=A0A7M7SVR4_STRPU|nr:sushi, nidogen and EGF-like domain-containing protein 1 [Strongylocentrotus purpuratus]